MNAQSVFDYIVTGLMATDLLDFAKVNSETGRDVEGSKFFAELLRREGFDVHWDEVERDQANVYAVVRGVGSRSDHSGRSLLFNGHVDTIPVGQCVAPTLRGGLVMGRGTEDMKGGLVAMVHAASALRKAGVRLRGDLWLTGVTDHENPAGTKLGPKQLIRCLNNGQIRADAIIIVEGPCAIWRASLGTSIFTFTIASECGQIHTLRVPYKDNPARWLGELLLEFENLEREFAAAPPHPICGREQMNVGMISGGDYFNRLPTPITVTGKWRWKPGKSIDDLRVELERLCAGLAKQSGLHFAVSFAASREPHETPEDHPVVQALNVAAQAVAGRPADIIGMALNGDANFYANEANVPTVYYGLAYETAHSDREGVLVSQITHCARVYALAAMEFCGVAGSL